jgi:polar amino acid transport system substrate-binding protein
MIGATRGYTYTDQFWDYANSNKLDIETTDNDVPNFTKLIHGRIDLFPIDVITGTYILRTEFKPGMAELVDFNKNPFVEVMGHLLFPKS